MFLTRESVSDVLVKLGLAFGLKFPKLFLEVNLIQFDFVEEF